MTAKEFKFDQECVNGGVLTFRCLCFELISPEDDFTEADLNFIQTMVEVLNENIHRFTDPGAPEPDADCTE